MSDVAVVAAPRARRETARIRRRRDDLWIAISALAAALFALPLAQSSWHGPEVSSVLAIAATAMFAGQRWAIAVIVIAELLLVPTVWPRAFLGPDLATQIAAFGSLIAMVPGVLAMRRAAAALVLVTGWRRTRETCRRFHLVLVALGFIASLLPML
ncbi:MAG: hypothetical protein H0V17_30255 [Deltaproteobacteria bacterium]|nr:hypothetical protein [Deltaproteobacteria bacterium]